jgi:hypothetical protein
MKNSDPKISIISIVVIIVANIIEDKKKGSGEDQGG